MGLEIKELGRSVAIPGLRGETGGTRSSADRDCEIKELGRSVAIPGLRIETWGTQSNADRDCEIKELGRSVAIPRSQNGDLGQAGPLAPGVSLRLLTDLGAS